MPNDRQGRSEMDCAAYQARGGSSTVEAASDALDPREGNTGSDQAGGGGGQAESTDFFVFHQDNGQWAWQRLNPAQAVVEASASSFAHYLHCIADARRHGWKGQSLSLFCAGRFT